MEENDVSATAQHSTTTPNVKLILEGLMILFFERQFDGRVVRCRVAVLRNAPGHNLELRINDEPPDPPQPLADELELEVTGTSSTGITLKDEHAQIDRLNGPTGGNQQSIRWLYDFENELYRFPIGVRRNEFRPVLSLNAGHFYTEQVSENLLEFYNENDPPTALTTIGHVATEIGVDINLDLPGSQAVFHNGRGSGRPPLLVARPGDSYKVEFRLREPDDGQQHRDHANHYYNAVGHKIRPGEKKRFVSTPLNKVSPEAACLVATLGMSRLN